MTWPRVLTAVIVASAVAMGVAVIALAVWDPGADSTEPLLAVAAGVPALLVALVLAAKRPRTVIAPVVAAVGLAPIGGMGLGDMIAVVVRRHPEDATVSPLYAGFAEGGWMWLYVPAAALMLLFPDGRLNGPRWRWVVGGLVAVPSLFAVAAVLAPTVYREPFQSVRSLALLPDASVLPIAVILLASFLLLLLASAASVVVRYRRSRGDPRMRAQLRLFAVGASILPTTLISCWAGFVFGYGPAVAGIALALTAVAVPVAVAIAILRHRLYDVDRIAAASVSYGLLAAVLLAGFVGVAVVAGGLAGGGSPLVAAGISAGCVIALAPLRRLISRRVDRRFNPRRHTVRVALERLRAEVDAGRARPEELQATLRVALDEPAVQVACWIPGRRLPVGIDGQPLRTAPDAPASSTGTATAAVDGAALDGVRQVEVRLGRAVVGAIVGASDAVPPHLLRDAAAGSAVLVELIRGRLQLTAALAEVEASRARMLRAGDAERTRLQRDLHDGAQQRLVSLGMSLRLAQRQVRRGDADLPRLDGVLDAAVAELGTAVAELRAIAHGLRPAALDSGLVPALRSLAGTMPLPVRMSVCREPVPDDVATTVYYVASEALANVVKHASARSVEVRVARSRETVSVEVIDDGAGGARPSVGSGLAGLADRVAAAGGQLTVTDRAASDRVGDAEPHSRAVRGTLIRAVVPCAS